MPTTDELIKKMKDAMVQAAGVPEESVILLSGCHHVPILKLTSQNEQGYIYVCQECMAPVTKIYCEAKRGIN